jgi:hypothetical protein
VIVVAALLVVLAAPLEGFVAPLALPAWLDAGIACSWFVLLASGAFCTMRARRRLGMV